MSKNQIMGAKTENCPPVKNFKKVAVKIESGREKSEKSGRENDFLPVKKIEKNVKNGFHGHFWFSRGKKKTLKVLIEVITKGEKYSY